MALVISTRNCRLQKCGQSADSGCREALARRASVSSKRKASGRPRLFFIFLGGLGGQAKRESLFRELVQEARDAHEFLMMQR